MKNKRVTALAALALLVALRSFLHELPHHHSAAPPPAQLAPPPALRTFSLSATSASTSSPSAPVCGSSSSRTSSVRTGAPPVSADGSRGPAWARTPSTTAPSDCCRTSSRARLASPRFFSFLHAGLVVRRSPGATSARPRQGYAQSAYPWHSPQPTVDPTANPRAADAAHSNDSARKKTPTSEPNRSTH